MSKTIVGRASSTSRLSLPTGTTVQTWQSDIHVSKLATGQYRCFKCPRLRGQQHGLFADPIDVAMHIVAHELDATTAIHHEAVVQGIRRLLVDMRRAGDIPDEAFEPAHNTWSRYAS